MKGDTVVSGLIRKRRELVRDINGHHEAVERLRIDVAAIDHVLLVWRPQMDLESIPDLGPARMNGQRGQLSRAILAALRLAGEPLGITDLTRRVMAARGFTDGLPDHRRNVRKALQNMQERGLVASVQDGSRLLWEIVR